MVNSKMIQKKRKKINSTERQLVYDKCKGHCAYCGCEITIKQMQVDHVYPFNLGGDDDIGNMLPACRPCNKYKHTLTLEKFRDAISKWNEILNNNNATYRNAVRFGQITPTPKQVVFYFETMEI
jgi:5-methylcytosine-specific restriction endonuclease McrA